MAGKPQGKDIGQTQTHQRELIGQIMHTIHQKAETVGLVPSEGLDETNTRIEDGGEDERFADVGHRGHSHSSHGDKAHLGLVLARTYRHAATLWPHRRCVSHRVPVYPAPKSMPRAPTVAPTAISGTGPTRHRTMAPTVASASPPGTSPATAVGSTFSKATVIMPMMVGLMPWRAAVSQATRSRCSSMGRRLSISTNDGIKIATPATMAPPRPPT